MGQHHTLTSGTDLHHHCLFGDIPFGDRNLRLECPDYEVANVQNQNSNWERFTQVQQSTDTPVSPPTDAPHPRPPKKT